MKRALSLLLALVLVISLVPFQAHAAQGGKLIAITFDDGPSAAYTEKLLDGLKERGVKVTFFVQGQSASGNLDILKRAYEEGHEIASHTWNHPDLTELSVSQIESQISRTEAVMDKVCGEGTEYLVRPPYGSTNSTVRSTIQCPLIYWSVDTRDWEVLNANKVRDNIISMSYDGAIVLMHDIHGPTIDGALMGIDWLLKQGYELVTVSELYRRRGVEMRKGVLHYDCDPNGTDLGPVSKPKITYTTADKKTMTVTLTGDKGVPIYYTTDGTTPNGESQVYTGPFEVDYPSDIHAVAGYNMNGCRSDEAVLEFGVTPCTAPTLRVEDGLVVMECEMSNADIYYTIDGTKASAKATLYTGPVELPGGHYIHAVAGGEFYKMSPETVLYYSGRNVLSVDLAPEAWFFDPMDRMISEGLMKGMGEYRYEPETELTRAMLVTLLYRYSGESLGEKWEKTYTFKDVDQNQWYAESVEWAYRNGIVSGYSETKFNPNGDITREELCKVIAYFLTYREHDLAKGESAKDLFKDYGKIASWALPSVEAMVSAGLIQGDGTNMNPKDTATRAEVATILCRVMDYEAPLMEEEKPEEPVTPPEVNPDEPVTPPEENQPTEPPKEDEPEQDPSEGNKPGDGPVIGTQPNG